MVPLRLFPETREKIEMKTSHSKNGGGKSSRSIHKIKIKQYCEIKENKKSKHHTANKYDARIDH